MEIRVEEASRNAAYDAESNSIFCHIGNTTIEVDLWAVNSSEVSHLYLEDVPLRISPIIAPGDGVADFFVAIDEDSQANELRIVLFIDGDWVDLVKGQLYGHSIDFTTGNGIREAVRKVNLDEAVDGVHFVEFEFDILSLLERPPGTVPSGPLVAITNIVGTSGRF